MEGDTDNLGFQRLKQLGPDKISMAIQKIKEAIKTRSEQAYLLADT